MLTKKEVISAITQAFKDVELGDGIGLWQAQAIDDYETEAVQLQKRANDRKVNWQDFDPEELQRCHSSLSFFDADGMRFHLPAYIIASMNDLTDDPVFHLTSLDEYGASRFKTLSNTHKNAIVQYLEWCLEQQEFEFEHPSIARSLENYWRV